MKKNLKNKLALSYAEALYEAAATPQEQDVLLSDMQKLSAALRQDTQIVKYLANPLWKNADKKTALRDIASAIKLDAAGLRCLELMAENNRLGELPQMAESYVKTYYRRRNIAEVSVTSAIGLTEEQQRRLEDNLQTVLAKKVAVSYVLKPEILGGLIICCDSKMIDDSVAGKLKHLELLMKGKK